MEQMTFDELVKELIQTELDSIIRGEPLAKRIRYTANLAAQWRTQRTEWERKQVELDSPN